MHKISESFLNEKRLNLISRICGEKSKQEIKEELSNAFNNTLKNLDKKTLDLVTFISKIDNIGLLSDENKPMYNLRNRKVHVINTQSAADKAVKELLNSKLVGFDSEQKPTFTKGEKPSNISIVQIADEHNCYVFQIQQIKNIKPILGILTNPNITKVGIGLRGDTKAFLDEFHIRFKCCIDFGALFKSKLYYENEIGAKKSVLFFLDEKLQKSGKSSRSNWENRKLSDSQIKYASEDAACVYDVFKEMLLKYPFLVEILPEWFQDKYSNKYF